ncbi:hypothetical protein [Pseudarthrobacter sp. B4EP4b]|uniref:hypothetical protein n=1 Tax=Pseudarthrobacter sp. B4EP4b TaxID=2590664 RepID=UPI001152856C|nr:hypothetical protein [Pseudarthrobacter sp. B4EP4b]
MQAVKEFRMKAFAALAIVALLLGGCSSKEPAPEVEPSVPTDIHQLDSWAVEMAKQNDVHPNDRETITSVVRVLCTLIPKRDNLEDLAWEAAKIDRMGITDTVPLIGIAIYGYCPKYKQMWKDWGYNDGKFDFQTY